uniref:PH domain-containing protein n=1 Tax=Strongyloides papillosus TaxID=174720 RepID=A0A0N5BPE5_STREA
MNDEEFNNWGRAFKEIHNRSPKKDDYDIAPISIQEYFHKKDAERRALLKRKQPLECRMIVPNEDIINKPSIYSIVKRNRKTPRRSKKECGSKEVEKNVIEKDKIDGINITPQKSILESPLKGWRMPSNFKNNLLKTPTSEVKKRKVDGDFQAVTLSSPTKVILSKKSTGEIRKNLFHALKKLGSE